MIAWGRSSNKFWAVINQLQRPVKSSLLKVSPGFRRFLNWIYQLQFIIFCKSYTVFCIYQVSKVSLQYNLSAGIQGTGWTKNYNSQHSSSFKNFWGFVHRIVLKFICLYKTWKCASQNGSGSICKWVSFQ